MAGHPPSSREPATPRPAELVNAFKWSFLGESASRLIAPAVFLVLARLLTPEDFGVVAAAMVVTSLCQVVADVGLGKALVQRQTEVEASANAAFWMTLAASLLLGGALFAMHAPIAAFFDDQRIGPVVQLLAVLVPLTGLAAVPTALLQRQLAFRELFWVRLFTAGLPALASIPLAVGGFGYWALVAGTLAGQLLQCTVLWLRSGWKPALRFDPSMARKLIHFGRWTTLSALLAWGYGWLDALFVARYFGPHDMGIYRIATTFTTLIFGLLFAPLLPVFFSVFSRTGQDRGYVGSTLIFNARAAALLAFPVAALMLILSSIIERTIFGPSWHGLAPLLSILAISQSFAWMVGANGEAYRGVGHPHMETWALGISIAVYLIGYLIASKFDLLTFVAARSSLVVVGIVVHIWFARLVLGLRPAEWFSATWRPLILSCIAMCPAFATLYLFDGVAGPILAAAAFITIYLNLIWHFEKKTIFQLWNKSYAA